MDASPRTVATTKASVPLSKIRRHLGYDRDRRYINEKIPLLLLIYNLQIMIMESNIDRKEHSHTPVRVYLKATKATKLQKCLGV